MDIHYSSKFKKQYKKLPRKVQEQFNERLIVFISNQYDPQLNIHKLSGELDGLWSINITGDIRAIIDRKHDPVIIFITIGSHSELYS